MTSNQTLVAAAQHDALVAAHDAQSDRVAGPQADAWAGCAQMFKADPRREPDGVLTRIADFLTTNDVLIDVGGGAGRMGLPLALRCREVINVEPSAGMGEAFEAVAEEARIANVRFIPKNWLEADGVEGDVALVAHVTYFVPQIVPFIQKLSAASRRRVIVAARSVPPPNQIAPFFRLAHGEDLAPVPGPNELLAVLKEMGITAELIDVGPAALPATTPAATTREDAVRTEVESAVRGGWLSFGDKTRVAALIEQNFDVLLTETPEGYRRRIALDARDVLITWEAD